MSHTRRAALGLALVVPLTFAGCGKSDRLPVHPVTGRVTFDGKPVAGAMVVFHPLTGPAADAKLRPVAAVQDDGSFQAHTYDYKDGLPAGDYAVTVHWLKPTAGVSGKGGKSGDEESGGAVSGLPARYEKPETSGLKVTVEARANDFPPMALTR